MSKFAWIVTFVALTAAPAAAESAIPDLRGTWKGESESIVMGAGNAHHSAAPAPGPRRNGSIYMVDDDGYTVGTMLAPNRIELCYMRQASDARVASCTEMTKQP
jgi:hypothetical protein